LIENTNWVLKKLINYQELCTKIRKNGIQQAKTFNKAVYFKKFQENNG